MLLGMIADNFTGASAIANTMAEDLQHDLELRTERQIQKVSAWAEV